jgi:hypothetical protein
MAFTFKQLKQAKSNLMAAGLDPAAAAGVLSSAAPEIIEKIMAGDIPQGIKDQCTKDPQRGKDQGANDPQVPASATQHTKDQEPRKDQKKNLVSRKAGKDQGTAQRSAGLPTMEPAHDQVGKNGKEKTSAKRSAQALKRSSAPQHPAFDTPAGVPQATALDCPQECAHVPDDPHGAADPHALPAGLYDEICSTIDFYCQQNDIKEPRKMHPHEWKSLCIYIGQGIKARKLLQDVTRLKEGGFRYDPQKLLALLNIYDYTCGQYKQVPFEHNFARFAGVSLDYLKDYMEKGLTSAHVGLREKAHDIQTAGLIDGASGGGSASVPLIFLCKALGGLSETVTVQHVAASSAPQVAALPVFDDGGALLPEK